MSSEVSPVASRRELSQLLRQLRQQHGLSLNQAGRRIGLDSSFLSRIERGQRGPSDDSIDQLIELYHVPPATGARLRQLAIDARQTSWWDDPLIAAPIQHYIGLEQVATTICSYGSVVPGLLQTRAYAQALTRATAPGSKIDQDQMTVGQRLRRQDVLDRADPPWLMVILDESVLHRVVGGDTVHREQLRALRAAAERRRTTLQIITFGVGAHPGIDSRFVMLSTSADQEIDFVHVEGLSGFRNYEKQADIGWYVQVWRQLTASAESPSDTIALIDTVLAAG